MIQFTVYGTPVAQGRPRFSSQGGFNRAYDPKKSKDFKKYVKLVAAEHRPKKLFEGPLQLFIRVYKPTLKNFSKKKLAAAESGELRPVTKPDVDNYVKGIKDACNQVLWKDDSQVVELLASKWYSETPRIEIMVVPIEQ
ncbi:RusA family crossover junction endodeoxyribonuclease [Rossellomorea aquimaris]|uniref:RusA family crossover junction endodeoxyribonuclease n=1 Tax=Rossellomorea aquimaris TaxID=189382 RepID=A0A5D4TT94_9BACI|nr:RusA family crossover junction endodeoxyribonuclease [Rossellomorea aquimaris]TYS78031.1 RusA family crossover junction endodeoxyribonuclease [Rossellomorea aquimaris]TYS87322.1 RusA family crossover junction endodeoxyribonuclease [Rossellomorea aquimaris]